MKAEYKKYYEQFGLNVVYYRKRKRLTQMQLAELADIDRSHISAIELRNVGVSFDVIFKLCEVLEVTPKQLFDFRDREELCLPCRGGFYFARNASSAFTSLACRNFP